MHSHFSLASSPSSFCCPGNVAGHRADSTRGLSVCCRMRRASSPCPSGSWLDLLFITVWNQSHRLWREQTLSHSIHLLVFLFWAPLLTWKRKAFSSVREWSFWWLTWCWWFSQRSLGHQFWKLDYRQSSLDTGHPAANAVLLKKQEM